MMWLLVLLSIAFGAKPQISEYIAREPALNTFAPGTGYVALELSPATRIVQYPRTQPMVAQLAFYGNRVPLNQQIKTINTRWIADTQIWSVGNGAWILTIYFDSPNIEVEWTERDELTIFVFKQGKPKPEEAELPVLDALSLATNPPARRELPPPATLLHPLHGDALTMKSDPRYFSLSFTPWRPPTSTHPLAELANASPTSWSAIQGYRQILAETRSLTMMALANYLLGIAHYNLGLPREATYYLGEAIKVNGNWPKPTVYLAHAQAAMAADRWEVALESCTKAIEYGAEEVLGLECLAIIALETGSPSPSHVARAISATSEETLHQVLAGQLYLIDGQYDSARTTLEHILEDLPSRGFYWSRLAWANYGDALLGSGKLIDAQQAFGRAGHSGPLGELARSRRRMIQMMLEGPLTWTTRLNELKDRAEKDGPLVHAENYYLMAQIARLYDDPTLATEYLRTFQRQHKRLAKKADLNQLMIDICRDRLQHLHAHARYADEAAFFHECWRPELDQALEDTSHMERVVQTYERLGLTHNAMLLQIRLLAIQTAAGNIRPDQIAHLAHLYAETGRPEETYKTTDFIRELPNTRGMEPTLRLLEARGLYQAKRLNEAEQAYLKAAQLSESRDESRIRLALLHTDVRRCDEALPVLQTAAANPTKWPIEAVGIDTLYLAMSRCLVDTGAHETADEALDKLRNDYPVTSEELKQTVEYLDVVNTMNSNGAYENPVESLDGIWKQLVEEERKQSEFNELFKNR